MLAFVSASEPVLKIIVIESFHIHGGVILQNVGLFYSCASIHKLGLELTHSFSNASLESLQILKANWNHIYIVAVCSFSKVSLSGDLYHSLMQLSAFVYINSNQVTWTIYFTWPLFLSLNSGIISGNQFYVQKYSFRPQFSKVC